MNSHTFSMKTQWIVSITAMLQVVCDLDRSLRVYAPHTPNFCTTFYLLFLPKQQFSTEQNWCFEMKLWSKVNFRRNIYLICTCPRLLLFWQEKFYEVWGKFSSHKISLCSNDFEQLWLCLFEINACTMKQLFLHLEVRGCGGLSL